MSVLGMRLNRHLFGTKKDGTEVKFINRVALTLSICENMRVSRKFWKNVTHDHQEFYLTSELMKLRDFYCFEVIQMKFETGPKNNCRHLHALIEFDLDVVNIKEVEDRINLSYSMTKYRTVDLTAIYDYCGWIDYITKDENNILVSHIDVNTEV